jgi:hypothetical protein
MKRGLASHHLLRYLAKASLQCVSPKPPVFAGPQITICGPLDPRKSSTKSTARKTDQRPR